MIGEHAFLELEDRDVGLLALAERADLGKTTDGARRGHGGAVDDLLQLHAERQHLRHAVGHVRLRGQDARGVDVGADDVGRKAEAHRAIRHGPQEASAAVPEIEEDAPLAGLVHERLDLARSPVEDLHVPVVVEVRVQIAGPHLLEHLGARIAPGPAQDVVVQHDRTIRKTAGFHGALDGDESLAAEMRVLDTDNQIGILENLARRRLRSMSSTSLSSPPIPRPTMLMNVSTRVLARREDLLAVVLEVAPAGPPASTTVVVPAGSATSSGKRAPLYPYWWL